MTFQTGRRQPPSRTSSTDSIVSRHSTVSSSSLDVSSADDDDSAAIILSISSTRTRPLRGRTTTTTERRRTTPRSTIGLGTTLLLGALIIAGYVYIERQMRHVWEQELNETSTDWYYTSFQKEEEDLLRENTTTMYSGDGIAATTRATAAPTTTILLDDDDDDVDDEKKHNDDRTTEPDGTRTTFPPSPSSSTSHPIWSASTTNTTTTTTLDSLRFCSQSRISMKNDQTQNDASLKLLYQCKGPAYEVFGQTLHEYAAQKKSLYYQQQSPKNTTTTNTMTRRKRHSASWGQHDFPMPANTTVLLLGNSHLRQVSKTVLCHYYYSGQHARIKKMTRIQKLSEDVFAVDFANGGRWISITNSVFAYSKDFQILWEEEILQVFYPLNNTDDDDETTTTRSMDNHHHQNLMIVMGKFSTYEETKGLNFVGTMNHDKHMYLQSRTQRLRQQNASNTIMTTIPLVDFQHIPPPTLLEIAQAYSPRHIVVVPMFQKSDQERAQTEWKDYREWSENNNNNNNNTTITTTTTSVYIETREFIDELGQECGSDDRFSIGTCHEDDDEGIVSQHHAGLAPRPASEMHRCAGKWGGHADLVAWSLVEGLHQDPQHTD